jgi:hypothetical protein
MLLDVRVSSKTYIKGNNENKIQLTLIGLHIRVNSNRI